MAGRGAAPGERRGGRGKGAKNKATIEREARAISGRENAMKTGMLPLDVILHRMRGTMEVTDEQVSAAIAAAPYLHPRLSAVAQANLNDFEKWSDQELRDDIARIDAEEKAATSRSSEQVDPPQSPSILH